MPPAPQPPAADLLQRIPLSAMTVLDVGCGQGELGAAFKRYSPAARVMGIEQDPELAAIAAIHLDDVAVMDPDASDPPFEAPEGYDCIIYSSSLAHMRDPFATIRRHAELLHPDGVMLMCVPNVEHWSFVERLLRGTFDYEPAGLFDRGHLRWFSLESMRKGLLEAGMFLCDASPRIFDAEAARQFTTALAPGLAALGIDPQAYVRRAAALQYVWRVRKKERERISLAGTMLPPVGGVSHVRVIEPFQAMSTDPMVSVNLTNEVDLSKPHDGTPHIFVLHRPSLAGQQGRDLLRMLTDAGWLVVTEFDDHPDFFSGMQDDAQLTFRGVHAIQTSTPALAEVLRGRNPEIAIFPNAIDVLPEVRNFAQPRALTMFFGALNREQDWRDYLPIVNDVADMAGDRLRFEVVHDDTFFNALSSPHKHFTPICDYPTYKDILGRCEISFMPLSDNGFNRAKSDLKFIEAASHRVVSLASNVVYGDSIVDGQTGFLFRDPQELRSRLMRLIVMPELARTIGDRARDYVARERMLAYQVKPRLDWYRSLWARREQLNAALSARVGASG
jgi:SAM-dependent methyltransferase